MKYYQILFMFPVLNKTIRVWSEAKIKQANTSDRNNSNKDNYPNYENGHLM